MQFPQVTHRFATSLQRGCSRLPARRLCGGRLRRALGPSARPPPGDCRAGRLEPRRCSPRHARATRPAPPRRGCCQLRPGVGAPRRRGSRSTPGHSPPRPSGRSPSTRKNRSRPARKAVHGDDERPRAPRLVVTLDEPPLDEHPVLDRDCVQLAGANAEEGEWRPSLGPGSSSIVSSPSLVRARNQADARREEELLPGVRPHGIAEAGRVLLAPGEAVAAPVPARLSTDRQVGRRVDPLVVDDRTVPEPRAEHEVPAPPEYANERLEVGPSGPITTAPSTATASSPPLRASAGDYSAPGADRHRGKHRLRHRHGQPSRRRRLPASAGVFYERHPSS